MWVPLPDVHVEPLMLKHHVTVRFPSGQVDLRQCHYLVDLDTEEETPLEPRYSANKDEWSVVAYKPFLQASR